MKSAAYPNHIQILITEISEMKETTREPRTPLIIICGWPSWPTKGRSRAFSLQIPTEVRTRLGIYLISEIWCQTGHETYQGKADAAYRSGGSVGQTDPTIWVSAMAAVSKNVSFGITGSTSYINVRLAVYILTDYPSWLLKPFILARTWSTLDHATQGRIAWNVVTSYSNASAKAMGKDSITPKHLR